MSFTIGFACGIIFGWLVTRWEYTERRKLTNDVRKLMTFVS